MKLIPTNDKPNGAIVCTREDLEVLKAKGWVVSMHHDTSYSNFIGADLNGLKVGFCSYLDNLCPDINTPEVGYYSDSWNGDVYIKSQEDLDKFIQMIDCMVYLSKIKM